MGEIETWVWTKTNSGLQDNEVTPLKEFRRERVWEEGERKRQDGSDVELHLSSSQN